MNAITKQVLGWIAGIFLMTQVSFAGNYAYIYIEGDKQTPFYVKMEGQMQPRLGKNYCIIPNLAAGITYLEILFQQNAYPAQKFAINIPEGGGRGFVLQKVNDRQFALYDMQQGNYIVSGNKPEDDRVPETAQQPAAAAENKPVAVTEPVVSGTDETLPAFERKNKKTKSKPVKEQAQAKEEPGNDNRFIGDMELNTDGGKTTAEPLPDFNASKPVPVARDKKKAKAASRAGNKETSLAAIPDEEEVAEQQPVAAREEAGSDAGIPNSDCKSAMTSEDFENFALKILDKADDDARIKVLSRNKGKQCFTTEQVRIIANNLDTQSGRYDVVKMLYPQTSDQGNYYMLESLFKTNYLRNKFREIINPK
jgi:hypothetical protein